MRHISQRLLTIILIFGIALSGAQEGTAAQKIGDKCLKKDQIVKIGQVKLICLPIKKSLKWQIKRDVQVKLPSVTQENKNPTSSSTLLPTQIPAKPQNPVVKKINSIMGSLSAPVQSSPPVVEWSYSDDLNKLRLEQLKLQHQKFSDAYPELYTWAKPALAIVSPDPTWLRNKMEDAGCQGGVIEHIRKLEIETSLIGAGTSVCGGRLTAFFLDRNMPDVMWSNILGSEFGGVIQENAYKQSPAFKSGNANWYSNTPFWYAEGSQTVLSVIALTKSSRVWSHQGRNLERINSYCADDTLKTYRCGNFIGEAAAELLIALYGWNAPLTLFENIDAAESSDVTFERTFQLSFSKFQEWADSYFRYLAKAEPVAADLLARLEN